MFHEEGGVIHFYEEKKNKIKLRGQQKTKLNPIMHS
jgi:hypothetical protein